MKGEGHPALVLLDLHIQEKDLINLKFVHSDCILTTTSKKKRLTTSIKRLKVMSNKEYTLQLDWIGYVEAHACYLAHLAG